MILNKLFQKICIIAFLSSINLYANDKPVCAFNLSCSNGGKSFSLNFKSISGDCSEDDMQATFSSDQIQNEITTSLKQNWYFFTNHISKKPNSVCKEIGKDNEFAAYSVSEKMVLLFVLTSGRPGYDNVVAVLLNSETGEVLDQKELGRSKNKYVAVFKVKNKKESESKIFKLRIINNDLSLHEKVTCDCDASYIDDWMRVSIEGNKINSSWMEK